MASQIFADLYGCNKDKINNMNYVKECAHRAIFKIGAEIVEEVSHQFSPIGITYVAVISTSHFSIHTWPEYGYVAVDVFSCVESVTNDIMEQLVEDFEAKDSNVRSLERIIEKEIK